MGADRRGARQRRLNCCGASTTLVASFDPAPHTWPRAVPAAFRGGTISHNDPNLDNVIFAGGRAVALIDFDLASPGSPVCMLPAPPACGCCCGPTRTCPEALRGRPLERLRLFADAYGVGGA